jgi:hypothetical protein
MQGDRDGVGTDTGAGKTYRTGNVKRELVALESSEYGSRPAWRAPRRAKR